MSFPIGTFHRDGERRERKLLVDAGQLIKTRMLVTANSGHGKSYLLRVMLEQLGRSTPIIVLDREGEFVTLGEKLDVVQVGPHGQIPADVRSAGMLCRRLMEKRLSAVIDMSELPFKRGESLVTQQRAYVREFLEQLVELPRKLWRPTFIAIDEAHLFAPEKGYGEAESLAAVINAATLGRKRAYCTIFATQRIAKLHKDAAAEQQNRFTAALSWTTTSTARRRTWG
jgi:DNA helicase HerA-like ATPase